MFALAHTQTHAVTFTKNLLGKQEAVGDFKRSN